MIINQILVDDKWVDGEPTEDGQKARKKIPVGETFGYEEYIYSTVEPAPDVIKLITTRAFMQRFTQTERIEIRNSVDDIVADIRSDLDMANHVDLDDSDVSDAVDALIALTSLEPGRKTALLANGTEKEAI